MIRRLGTVAGLALVLAFCISQVGTGLTVGQLGDISGTRYPEAYARGSLTAGIQEAIDRCAATGCTVRLTAKEYSTSRTIWLHNNTHLEGSGVGPSTIKRKAGTISDSDPNVSGALMACGPLGSNGTQFSSGSQGSNIAISNVILDGNQSAFTSLTNANLALQGLRCLWVSGLRVHGVRIQNTLMDAFYLSNSDDWHFSDISADTVGQWSVLSSRNGLTLTNNDNSSTAVNRGTLNGFSFKAVGDEAIALIGTVGASFSNGTVDGADFGIEFTAGATVGFSDLNFSNIGFKNLLAEAVSIAPTAGTVTRCNWSNITAQMHASNHDGGVVFLGGSGYDATDLQFRGITATNINSKDTTSRSWIDIQSAAGKLRQRIFFTGLDLTGKSGSTRTGDNGFNIRHSVTDLFVSHALLKDVAGIGISMDDATATDVQSNLHFDDVTVDGANYFGARMRNNTGAAVMKEVFWTGSVMKDCAKQGAGSNAGWYIEGSVSSSVIQDVFFSGCRSYKTSGSNHAYGLVLAQSNSATLDGIQVTGSDFSGTNTGWFSSSGTVTGVRFTPRTGRGSDITSATTITIPPDGSIFHVTGSTAIATINVNPWDNGRCASLIMDSTAQVADSSNQKLSAAGPNTADDTLDLCSDGTSWFEVGRSVN